MAITMQDCAKALPFARVGFTYTGNHKMLVNGTDGSKSTIVYPMGVSKIADYVVGFGTELRYTEMVRTAARAQHVDDTALAESFIGKPLNGYEWLDGYRGAVLRAIKTGALQLRGYAIDDDGIVKSHNVRYIDNATGAELDFERDLKKFMSTAPSAVAHRGVQHLIIDGIELHSVDGTPIVKPACKNFALANITNWKIDP